MRGITKFAAGAFVLLSPAAASAQTVEELQRQIDELKAELRAMKGAQAAPIAASPVPATTPIPVPVPSEQVAVAPAPAAPIPAAATEKEDKAWYERLTLRGYTQMRYNAFVGGDRTAPAGRSRVRSVHDSAINENGNFALRRARLVLQGDITDDIALYFQTDFASAVNGQSNGERRENYGQLRDAYVDVFLDEDHEFKLRLGQSKVPFGWENLQSSSNRLTLDRSDGINSAVPSERDIGVVVYYTPKRVQKIWDRLADDGQKLFGNYGAFAVGLYNGQGVNRSEQNRGFTKVAMATWPFELGGGQVLEVGGAALFNKVRPEVRSGGVSDVDFKDNHYGVHGILYPQPFGVQAEWSWGKTPQYDLMLPGIRSSKAQGGYVQVMYDVGDIGLGKLIPYGRWQHYRGGWKAGTNAPRLETDEIEVGVEWQIFPALELTVAYANMKRAEADERRTGRAEGDLIRTQVQFNY